MFGLKSILKKFNSQSSGEVITPIFVKDFINTTEDQTNIPLVIPSKKGTEGNIITLPLLEKYLTNSREYETLFNNAIIGKCDGEFPVTNPVVNSIYYYPADKKYYVCKTAHTGVIETPDDKFSELTLFNVSKTGGTKQVTISGAVSGNGTANGNGVISITSTYGAMSSYKKGTAGAITTSDTPVTAIGKLEAGLDGKSPTNHNHDSVYSKTGHTHVWANITDRPSTLPNPNGLIIKFNGGSAKTYTGSEAIEVDITPASIGAQPVGSYASSSHNHDSVYAKISHGTHVSYATIAGKAPGTAAVGTSSKVAREDHVHPLQTSVSGNAGTATKLAAARKISLSGDASGSVSFDGSTDVTISVTVADDSHNHSWSNITGKPSSFTPSSHNQASNTITAMTGYVKASSVSAITATDNLNVAIGKLEKALDGKQPVGSYASSSHNHDTVYAKTSHTHDDRYYTESEINSKLSGYSPTNHTHADYLSTKGGTVSGALTVTGQILSNADVVAYSDARFKTNIRLISNPIDKILSINGYYYNMLGIDNSHQVGVIAQEIIKVLPEAVFEDSNGHLGVRYTNIIPLLVEGFKAQQKEIEILKDNLNKYIGGVNHD